MRAWRVHEFGAPSEVLVLDEVAVPIPGPDELLIEVEAVTLNFNDLDANSISTLNDMRSILKSMNISLKKGAKGWGDAGLMQNSQRLRQRLQNLKDGVTLKR